METQNDADYFDYLYEQYKDEIEWLDYALDLQSGLFDEDIEIILKSK